MGLTEILSQLLIATDICFNKNQQLCSNGLLISALSLIFTNELYKHPWLLHCRKVNTRLDLGFNLLESYYIARHDL